MFAESGVQANVPEATHLAFFVAAMSECVCASVHEGVDSGALFICTAKAKAFGSSEDILSGFEGVCAFFDAGHGRGLLRLSVEQIAALILVIHRKVG